MHGGDAMQLGTRPGKIVMLERALAITWLQPAHLGAPWADPFHMDRPIPHS